MKRLLVVSAIAALGFSSVAFAGGLPEEMPAAPAPISTSDTAVYVGLSGGFGVTNWKDSNMANMTGATTKDDSGPVGRVFLGYDINKFFALEAGYTYFLNKPKFTWNALVNKVKSTSSVDFMIKGKLPVVNSLDLFAKVGVSYLMSKFDKDTAFSVTSTDKITTSLNTFNLGYGAGADYYITSNVIASIEWLRFNGSAKCDTKYQPNTDAFLIGLRYKFDL